MSVYKNLLTKQYTRFHERKWDTLYFIVDVHEVILKPNFEGLAEEMYPSSEKALKLLSDRNEVCLIMWTASTLVDRLNYMKMFRLKGIHFNYCNDNPEVAELANWGDYKTKMYANVLLDDKAGFDAEIHWDEILNFYEEHRDSDPLKWRLDNS